MSFCLGHTRFRAHPLLAVLGAVYLCTGLGRQLLPMLLALLLHECGHFLFARLCGMRVSEMEIMPYGAVMIIDGIDTAPARFSFWIAAGGPLFSLLGCWLAVFLSPFHPDSFPFAAAFFRMSLLLALVNLLPALPLDGGRMARALLSRWLPRERAGKALTAAGFVFGAFLCAVSLVFAMQGKLVLAPMMAGLYLFYAAAQDESQGAARYVTALIARRQRLDNRGALPVECVAAGEDTSAASLLKNLHPGKYHVIYLLGKDGVTKKGVIEEKEFCEGVCSHPGCTLGDIFKKQQPDV